MKSLIGCLDFEVEGQMTNARPMRTWKKEVEVEGKTVGLSREDVPCRSQSIVDVNWIAIRMR